MRRADFNYDLPDRLIAQAPLPRRGDSRLLHLVRGTGVVHDRQFRDLPDLLQPGDLLVTNDTRVIPARLFATKPTGGRVEILLERVLGGDADRDRCLAQLRCSKPPRPGMTLAVDGADDAALTVEGRDGVFWTLSTPAGRLGELLDRHGHMPLPPYIDRADTAEDRDRYQTVYSRRPGAVAAPTAGLHFSEQTLRRLAEAGIGQASVTLHVGAGTFQPVRTERLDEHRMHSEWYDVPQETVAAIEATRARGGRVIAVGTTAVRSLETVAADHGGQLVAATGESRLFIYPPYDFRVIDGLVTNFHLPESTLLMLVSAFAGHAETLAAYRHAVDAEYRFFSYGDAMLIL